MKKKQMILLLLTTVTGYTIYAQSSPKTTTDKKLYFELRPIQFFLDGYSVVGHYAVNDRMQIGANVFSATLSDGITDFVWNSQGPLDLEAKQDIVFGLSFRYFINKNKPHQSWFIGAVAGAEFYSLTNRDDNQELDYVFYYLAPRIGYIWYPLKKKLPNLFISAEAVLVFPLITDGIVTFDSGGSTEINDILPSPLIGIGYRF